MSTSSAALRNQVNAQIARELQPWATELHKKSGGQNFVITKSFVRSIATLGTQSDIQFNLLQEEVNRGSTSVSPVEQRIKRNDAFLATHVNVLIAKKETSAIVSKFKFRAWPNPKVFSGAGEADNFEGFYKGVLSVLRNQKVLFPGLTMEEFRINHSISQGVEISAAAQDNIIVDDEFDVLASSMQLTPSIRFSGSDNNLVKIELPESLALAGTNSTENVCILEFYGLLAQNAAIFVSDKRN